MKPDIQTNKANNYGWLLIPFIGSLFIALWGFTRVAIWDVWKFDSTTGQIGDTIGGITAPFINLLGAILVYLSFQQQRKANEIQISEMEKQRIDLQDERNRTSAVDKFNQIVSLIDDIEKNINTFDLTTDGHGQRYYKGIEAFRMYTDFAHGKRNSKNRVDFKEEAHVTASYINFLKFCLYIIDSIRAYDYDDPLTKEILTVKFINIISVNHETNGLVDYDMKTIHDYAHEIQNQVHGMKINTSHFKPE